MEQELNRKTMVIGHRNPDTDSICSAICYANLKQAVTGEEYMPARAGHVNGETQFVLDYFGAEEPQLVEDVRTQVRDIVCHTFGLADLNIPYLGTHIFHKTKGVADNISLKRAWNIMQENNVVTIPSVREDGTLEGLITVGDITKTYMNIYDSSILSKANTQYSNIIETLEAELIIGSAEAYFDQGKVLIAAANPDLMEFYIEPHDLVILGNRYESQLCAIEMGADCIIVCEGAAVSMTIKKIAQERGCTIIATTYDTYTAARLINQSMPISYFMTREHLITFNSDDYIDEIREVMASKRHRDFPILDKDGRYLGMISRRNLLGAKGKQVILVDHNEKNQAVAGIENAEILEIIDHHRLGTIQTMSPVFFRNQPLGCTATIIYQMYQEAGIKVEPKIAGLLCSAIVSDTLLFRSPTCTPVDEMAARALADIAGIDIEKYAMEMFSAGSNLKDKSDEEIFYQDFKRFTSGKVTIGVGQITSLNGGELDKLKGRMEAFMEKALENNGLNMIFFMLTNILTETTELICEGQGALQLAGKAFHQDIELLEEEGLKEPVLRLPGVVSRKKQLIPELMLAEQE